MGDNLDAFAAHEMDAALIEPYSYINGIPGKNIREKLIDAWNVFYNCPAEKVVIIKKIITMLHNASLLIDDIEDNSKLRRGVPVAHSIFGVPSVINSANYVYFKTLEVSECFSFGKSA